MFTVALTGGIASGKSAAARYFCALDARVIDADQIVHKLFFDPDVSQQIVFRFGRSVLTEDGNIDRRRLRNVVFSRSEDRIWLENLLHPLVYQELHSSLQAAPSIYSIVILPLLLEERTVLLQRKKPSVDVAIGFSRILLMVADQEIRLQRVRERDRLEGKQLDAILAAQLPLADSLDRADDIVCNNSSLSDLQASVQRLHQMYVSFAQAGHVVLEQCSFFRYYLTLK